MADEGEMPSCASSFMERLIDTMDSRLVSFEERMKGRMEGMEGSLSRRMDNMIDRLSFPTSNLLNPPNYQAPLSRHAPNELQGNKANSFTLVNEASSQLSVNDRLFLGDPNVSLLHNDNIQLWSVGTLVDPNDEKIDSSSKIDLCPPSVEAISALSCESHKYQLVYELSPLLGNVCEVFKRPQVNGNVENVGRLNGSDPLISFVVDHASIEETYDCISGNLGGRKYFLNPCTCTFYPFDPGDHLKYDGSSPHHLVLGQEDKPTMGEGVGTYPYDVKYLLKIYNLLERPKLCKGRVSNKNKNHRGVWFSLRFGTHGNLHERLIDYHGSSNIPLCPNLLNDQVVLTFWGYTPLIDHFDSWLYLKCVQPWHDVILDYTNSNPHAMRTNHFQEGEDDTIRISLKAFDYIF
ncbi:uncharacterized protein LOC124887218 [Capsicum annuum]|uniref:uncharacterized protein LOC124887218 n=1 Tax=Capsicum annuum TaxID=4072 RepID=UPI001FB09BB8|nr:uncharacterized protein LOC124887218 [Capsicum annuum]